MVLEIIKSRRSHRRFLDKPIPLDMLEELLEAARWAPSGGNSQPWAFVVVREPASVRKVKLFSPGLGGEPTALIILCSDQSADAATAIMDVSIAAQNVMLVATDQGLASCVIRSHNQTALQTLLNLPAHIEPELIVALGYPAKPGRNPGRRPLDEVVHWEEWGGRSNE
ncbi:nitroreductase family protein [Chloroflexota bacterium]